MFDKKIKNKKEPIMDLTKIAQNEEMTYLQKVAAIVDEFAAGNVTGEDADAIATGAGISTEDLLDVYTAAYGDIEKTAGDENEDAGVDAGAETGDLEKEAADEAGASLLKIAEDVESTYLTKCAGIADAYAAGAISGEDADALAVEIGLAPSDVASIHDAAYGDELEKEAGAKTEAAKKIGTDAVAKAKSAGESVKKFLGGDNFKKSKSYVKQHGLTGDKADLVEAGKEAAKGAGKVAGTAAVVGTSAKGAASMFGGKGDDK